MAPPRMNEPVILSSLFFHFIFVDTDMGRGKLSDLKFEDHGDSDLTGFSRVGMPSIFSGVQILLFDLWRRKMKSWRRMVESKNERYHNSMSRLL